jgi:hypothetical protein
VGPCSSHRNTQSFRLTPTRHHHDSHRNPRPPPGAQPLPRRFRPKVRLRRQAERIEHGLPLGDRKAQAVGAGHDDDGEDGEGAEGMMYTTPHMESIKQTKTEDYFLTHCIWHNGYGPCPETGARHVANGGLQKDFHLIQHGVRDFDFAEPIILRGLRKKWDVCRISDLIAWLYNRRRPRAVFI